MMTDAVDIIAAIRVGPRHRKDMGEIAGLARDIAEVGLLHPIVVTPDLRLTAGERRLIACPHLGWATVPVRIVGLAEIVRGELPRTLSATPPPSCVPRTCRTVLPLPTPSSRGDAGGRRVMTAVSGDCDSLLIHDQRPCP
jgi:hypothetical protein